MASPIIERKTAQTAHCDVMHEVVGNDERVGAELELTPQTIATAPPLGMEKTNTDLQCGDVYFAYSPVSDSDRPTRWKAAIQ